MNIVVVVILALVLCVSVLVESCTLESLEDYPDYEETYTVKVNKFPRSFDKLPRASGTCSEGVPCGYAILTPPPTEKIFVKGNCDCPEETKCNLDAVENSAYVYRCAKIGKIISPTVRELAMPPEFPEPE